MKHRSVVANYIFLPSSPPPARHSSFSTTSHSTPLPYPTNPAHVLLFHRSTHPNVRSYQSLLAPISGSIESTDGNALEAAERELFEETGLRGGRDLRLEFVGQDFEVTDEEAGRSWSVRAFGWVLLPRIGEGTVSKEELARRIKLDWEHDGFEIVEAANVMADAAGTGIRARCVPMVEESLGRVWLGNDGGGVFGGVRWMGSQGIGGRVFAEGMRGLREDKENGARVLAVRVLECLREIVRAMGREDENDNGNGSMLDRDGRERCWWVLRVVGWHLVHSARPSMNAAIGAAVCEALAAIKPLILDGTKGAPVVITKLDKSIIKRQSAVRLAEAFTKWTTELYTSCETINVVTLSSSSTIRNALHHLAVHSHFKHINISILESRPRCEGASLAASLLDLLKSDSNVRSRISITLAPDSHLPLLLSATSSSSPSPQSSEAQVTTPCSATILLLGADRVSPHGAVLNKTLSLSAAMLAKTIGPESTKVVVLAETDKIAGAVDLELFRLGSKFQWARERSVKKEMAQYGGEEGGTEEVLGVWEVSGVKAGDVRALRQALSHETEREAAQEGGGGRVDVIVRNETFEWVPPEWLDVYVTEQGVLGKEEIGKVALARTESEAEIFRDLYA